MRNKRGITPVIATVILVVLVISLSTIVFIWARSFIGEVGQKNGMPASQACSNLNIFATYSTVEGTLDISNNGNIAIHKTSISVESGGDIETFTDNQAILGGGSVTISNIPAGDSIEVTPLILVEVEGGRESFRCEDNVFPVEII